MAAACGPRRQMYPRCWKRLVVFQVRVDDQVYLWTKPTKCNHHQCNQSNKNLPYSLSILTTSTHALIFPTFIPLNHSLLFSHPFFITSSAPCWIFHRFLAFLLTRFLQYLKSSPQPSLLFFIPLGPSIKQQTLLLSSFFLSFFLLHRKSFFTSLIYSIVCTANKSVGESDYQCQMLPSFKINEKERK